MCGKDSIPLCDITSYLNSAFFAQTRIVFKNTSFDMRMFNNLKMFIHAANLPVQPSSTNNYDLTAIIRLGSDISDNFYQLEVPLRITDFSEISADSIWKNNC